MSQKPISMRVISVLLYSLQHLSQLLQTSHKLHRISRYEIRRKRTFLELAGPCVGYCHCLYVIVPVIVIKDLQTTVYICARGTVFMCTKSKALIRTMQSSVKYVKLSCKQFTCMPYVRTAIHEIQFVTFYDIVRKSAAHSSVSPLTIEIDSLECCTDPVYWECWRVLWRPKKNEESKEEAPSTGDNDTDTDHQPTARDARCEDCVHPVRCTGVQRSMPYPTYC